MIVHLPILVAWITLPACAEQTVGVLDVKSIPIGGLDVVVAVAVTSAVGGVPANVTDVTGKLSVRKLASVVTWNDRVAESAGPVVALPAWSA